MPEDQKSGFSKLWRPVHSAAHPSAGAIKTGRLFPPLPRALPQARPSPVQLRGAVWAGRKHIGKIIVEVIALLAAGIIVLMLPGLIFGGLTNAFSSSGPEIPILNSETAIIENANEMRPQRHLGRALEDVLARIEADFAASGPTMEVKMPIPAVPFITPTCLSLSIVRPRQGF